MRRRKRNKQRKLIILTSLSLLFILTVGYAAFQTNLNITAKGNILEKGITIEDLRQAKCNQTSGDGLYKDTYETNRCIYRGGDPDNYITFNDELWRIISIEQDNTLKIMTEESIGNMPYDKDGDRYQASGYCSHENNKTKGCNSWGSKTTTLDNNGNKITALKPLNGSSTLILPEKEAYLNTYLNTEYYGKLIDKAKQTIINHRWNIGQIMLTTNQTLETDIMQEKQNKWDGKIGLINATDYVKASLNSECKGLYYSRVSSYPCKDSWLRKGMWTISTGYTQFAQWHISSDNWALGHSFANTGIDIYPVVFLKSDITLKGKGTKNNPYTVTK